MNGAFIGGGVCSVIGLGEYAVMQGKFHFGSFSGASIGSLIAVSLAAGKTPEEIRDFLAENVETFCAPILGRKRIERRVNEFLQYRYFSDLPVECTISITPLRRNFPCLINRQNSENLTVGGSVALSSALPGLFLPGFVGLEGKHAFILDGGMLYNPPLVGNDFLFTYKRNDNPPKHFWNIRKAEQEQYADYVLKPLTNHKTTGKRQDVLDVYEEGRQAALKFKI